MIAYVRLSQAQRLAYGRTAEIVAWCHGRVLKLFYPWMKLDAIRHVHAIARAVYGAGVPSPGVGELITVDDRHGIEHKIQHAVGIDAAAKDRLRAKIRTIPPAARLCHGDFHPGNVLLTDNGPIVIDWLDATIGNPACDVARTSLLIRGYIATTPDLDPVERSTLVDFHDRYLTRYTAATRELAQEVDHWREVVAAARLSEGVVEPETWLVNEALRRG